MNEQKKGPGRPAKTPKGALAQIKATPKQRFNKTPTAKAYSLLKPNGALYMMRGNEYNLFDEKSNKLREVKYFSNQPSIFSDEQTGNGLKEPIVFILGELIVNSDKPNLIAFLENHPYNAANGGNVFEETNEEKKASVDLNDEFLIVDAVSMVRDQPLPKILAVATALNFNVDRSVDEIKHDLLVFAKANPKSFIDSFDSPVVAMKSKIKQAVSYQIIKADEDAVKWFDTNKHIISVPVGQDPVDVFVRYCMTEAGAPVVGEIERQLG